MNSDLILGMDLGGTNVAFGLVDDSGLISHRQKLPTAAFHNFESLAAELFNYYSNLPNKKMVKAIGVGAPNGNYYSGSIDFAPNLHWGEHIAVRKILEKVFSIPAVITNDANAAACGEKYYGGAKAMNDFAVITLGTGVGSGIYVNGLLLQGKNGFGGEFGHITVVENGRQCGCGKKGCLETYSSVTGIINTVLELLSDSSAVSILRDAEFLSGKVIEQAALAGDSLAMEAFRITGDYLGKALANYISVFDPEAIFLLGGLAQSGILIFDPTQKVMEQNLMKVFQGKVKLLPSQLPDADAAILGAAAIAREELIKK